MSKSVSNRSSAAVVFAIAAVCASATLAGAQAVQNEGVIAGGLQIRSIRTVHIVAGVDVVVAGERQRVFDFHWIENRPIHAKPAEPRSGDDQRDGRIEIESVLHVDDARARVVAHDRKRGAYAWLVPARIDLAEALFWWTRQPAGAVEPWEKGFWRRHRRASRAELAAMAHPAFSRGPAGVSGPTFTRSELRALTRDGGRYVDLAEIIAASKQRLATPPIRRRPLAH